MFTSLVKCHDLNALRTSLCKEQSATAQDVACGNRFHELRHDEKNLISCMSKELVQYEHYIQALKEATYLNRFIEMVQAFAQRKTRELYLSLSAVVSAAYSNCLEDLLCHLRDIYLAHDQLLSYLKGQSYRSWAVGTARNARHKYRAQFRYHFPACEFNHPLVVRNPDLWIDNAVRMFYTLVDLFTKFKGSRAYAVDRRQLLWLGNSVRRGRGVLRSSCHKVTSTLWIRCINNGAAATEGHPHDHHHPPSAPCCAQYNAIWFPQFHMYLQFAETQTLCNDDLVVEWTKTTNCTDPVRQRTLLERCGAVSDVAFELCRRPLVDWDLFCPFKLKLQYTQRDGCWCPAGNDAAHTTVNAEVVQIECVREDYVLVLPECAGLRAGTYVDTDFCTSNVTPTYWRAPLNQLVRFYKCTLDNQAMQLIQTQAQRKQIAGLLDSIQKNVAMYTDLIDDYVHIDNAQALNKIRKLSELVETVEHLLRKEPLRVVSTSKTTGKTQVFCADAPELKRHVERAAREVRYDSDVTDFSSDEEER